MLLSITTTHNPATDLGFLLYKNPANVQSFDLNFGKAHVFYPEASAERCTVCLLLDIDPVNLIRGGGKDRGAEGQFEQYVNDRPYVASSFMSVAIAEVFGSALSGKSRERAELVSTPLPLSVTLSAVPCREGKDLLVRLFEPLGYVVEATRHQLDPNFPDWGQSPYYTVTICNTCTLRDLLSHVYVLIPVLDNNKHYFIGEDEIAKLLRHGEGWLSTHPEKTLITKRYLKNRRELASVALERLADEDNPDPDTTEQVHASEEAAIEAKISLNDRRIAAVIDAVKRCGARRVIDMGCGEGKLLANLLELRTIKEVVGLDVSHRSLEIASARLHLERMPELQRERIKLLHGSLTYKDKRTSGFDAATCIEVIEHLDPPRLAAFERALFEFSKPNTIILTTPNSEYNRNFPTLPAGKFRHKDHRFEWTRSEFQNWANTVCEKYGYQVAYFPVGDDDPEVGPPTQMGVFSR